MQTPAYSMDSLCGLVSPVTHWPPSYLLWGQSTLWTPAVYYSRHLGWSAVHGQTVTMASQLMGGQSSFLWSNGTLQTRVISPPCLLWGPGSWYNVPSDWSSQNPIVPVKQVWLVQLHVYYRVIVHSKHLSTAASIPGSWTASRDCQRGGGVPCRSSLQEFGCTAAITKEGCTFAQPNSWQVISMWLPGMHTSWKSCFIGRDIF